MSNLVINVSNISKAYPVYESNVNLLKELITGKKYHDEYWALKNISFSIKEGQRLGIIGANGSGKSTLLKIITGHLTPTSGKIDVNGKISAMLSLNTVLNAEETGINNIRFNLLLNGCKKSQIEALVEEVIDFAELGAFVYSPVKTYSSGMSAKLAFAISTAIEPEILIIDEVLSVGDSYFVGKATQRMKELCDRGKALVFVSHSDAAVRMLCDTVLWLENGSIRMMGPVDQVLASYEEDYRRSEDELTRAKNRERSTQVGVTLGLGDFVEDFNKIRLVADNSKRHFEDSHYVRKISVGIEPNEILDIPLTLDGGVAALESASHLDLFGSQWGRVFGYKDMECRLLAPRTGRSTGGHVLIKSYEPLKWINIEVEAQSSQGSEFLKIEYADAIQLKWSEVSEFSKELLDGGWVRYKGKVCFPRVTTEQRRLAKEKIDENGRPVVEIVDAALVFDGVPVFSVKERSPFEIVVTVRARERIARCDVGLKIIREDGVYCFWQTSGQSENNLIDFFGVDQIVFSFLDNPFGAGEYTVSCYIADGWDYPENYPYSEVFDRKVAAIKFRVLPELPDVDMGCINIRASVTRRNIEVLK